MVGQEIVKTADLIGKAEECLRLVYEELDPEAIVAMDIEIVLGRLLEAQYMLWDIIDD